MTQNAYDKWISARDEAGKMTPEEADAYYTQLENEAKKA